MNRIKELRKAHGLKQNELAAMLHVAQGTISGYENGKYEPDASTLTKLAEIFGVTVGSIIGAEEPAPNEEADEVMILREKIRRDPERRALLDLAGNGSIEDIRQAVAVLDALKRTSRR